MVDCAAWKCAKLCGEHILMYSNMLYKASDSDRYLILEAPRSFFRPAAVQLYVTDTSMSRGLPS